MFYRGDFNINDVEKVALTLRYMLPGMIFMLISVIELRIILCFKNVEEMACLLGIFWILSYFILCAVLNGIGIKGIAMAYSITWMVYCLMGLKYIEYKLKEISKEKNIEGNND